MASYHSLYVCLRGWQLRLTGHQTQKHTANKKQHEDTKQDRNGANLEPKKQNKKEPKVIRKANKRASTKTNGVKG